MYANCSQLDEFSFICLFIQKKKKILVTLNYEQIGGRITSKRISQVLEECFPCTYILVNNHPYRQDPSHLVTHRIQSTIVQFADRLLKVQVPHRRSKWCSYLQTVQMMVFELLMKLFFLYFCS